MGRANWSSGYAHAQIVHDLLEEIGYEVDDPSIFELAPDLGYATLAAGDIHVWANSWYPGHLTWWEGTNGDLARLPEPMMTGGGLQGFLVTRSWALENGVTTLDQINADPELWGALDFDDDGRGEIYGCAEGWTCDDIINSQLAFAGWSNLEQVVRGYDSMFLDFLERVEAGEAAIAYTWAPTSYVAQARPGDLTMFISMRDASVLDASNPLGAAGGDEWTQRTDGRIGAATSEHRCLIGPDGCQLGWLSSDIEITTNGTWLEENPEAEALLSAIRFDVVEISRALLQVFNGDGSQRNVERAAADWIERNRDTVDDWIETALSEG